MRRLVLLAALARGRTGEFYRRACISETGFRGRMNGYAPERFVDLLTGRIRDALGQ
jgi:hypothetical protein